MPNANTAVANQRHLPNFRQFQESIADELRAVKDRVRSLVTHHGEDGAFKEAVLRAVLRRHLPQGLRIGSGFIVAEGYSSTQIDVLVIRGDRAVLFQDGDFVIVTPDAAVAAIEVKTSLTTRNLDEATKKLAKISSACSHHGQSVWTGLFAYSSGLQDGSHSAVREALAKASEEYSSGGLVRCVAFGDDFVRHWSRDEMPHAPLGASQFWRSYILPRLAPSYFIGNLAEHTASRSAAQMSVWFTAPDGKEAHSTGDTAVPRCV